MTNSGQGRTRFVVIDLETTGLLPAQGHRVIEIGAVAVQDGSAFEEFHSLVGVKKRITPSAQQIHGITNEMLEGEPKPENVFPQLKAFMADDILVAHNAQFDIGFLRHEFGRLGFALLNRYLCTLEMSRRRFPRLRDHKLQTVYRHLFSVVPSGLQQHRALDDARMVARVWMEMMKK